uniref:RRM domain-containing protein n=1 Tax=Araucaria cunninghamii TaxID=56994 RepID=A0A0D6R7A0_ARACU
MAAYPPPPANPYYHHQYPPPPTHAPAQQQFHPPYYAPPVPVPAPPYPQYSPQDQKPFGCEEVRTLFVAGLPPDVKYREVYNLFREFPGYRSCQLKHSGKGPPQVYAFSVFADQQSAIAAMHALNGMDFDPDMEAILHIELAKANSRAKRLRTDDGGFGPIDKRIRGSNSVPEVHHDTGVGGTVHMPGTSGLPSTQSGRTMEAPSSVQDGVPGLSSSTAPTSSSRGNPPCPTLFIANLGPTCSQEELTHVLMRCPGFLKLKMQIRGGLPVAFVDFQDTACSTQALSQLQNMILYSSDRGGMRVEYAKSRMGLPKRERRA